MKERFYCFNFTNGQIQTQIDWMGRANGTSVPFRPPKLAKLVYCLFLSCSCWSSPRWLQRISAVSAGNGNGKFLERRRTQFRLGALLLMTRKFFSHLRRKSGSGRKFLRRESRRWVNSSTKKFPLKSSTLSMSSTSWLSPKRRRRLTTRRSKARPRRCRLGDLPTDTFCRIRCRPVWSWRIWETSGGGSADPLASAASEKFIRQLGWTGWPTPKKRTLLSKWWDSISFTSVSIVRQLTF